MAILERWRASSGSVPRVPAVDAVAPIRSRTPRELPDEASLFAAFEAEIRAAAAPPLAELLAGWLAEPRDRYRQQPTEKHRSALLAVLDRIEDVLATTLLAAPRSTQ